MAGFNLKDATKAFENPSITLSSGDTYTGTPIAFAVAVPLVSKFQHILTTNDTAALLGLVPDICRAFGFPDIVTDELLQQPFVTVTEVLTYFFTYLPGKPTAKQSRKTTNGKSGTTPPAS